MEEAPDVVTTASEVLQSLLDMMEADVTSRLTQAHDEELGGPVFEIEGDDSGLLIGRRGETLRALQFLVRFMVSRRLDQRVSLMVDVEGYQERRYRSLGNMAQRVARRVANTGHSISLEPMPANERRAVHVALADHPEVVTESAGEGESRQVVVHAREE